MLASMSFKNNYPSTFLRTFFEQKRTIEPESFQTVYKWLEKQFSLIPTGRGQVETQKPKCFQNIYKSLGKLLSLIPAEKQQMHTQLAKYFQNIYNPPQEKLQNKKAVT